MTRTTLALTLTLQLLLVGSLFASSATLSWTAPGDDGNVGTASSYDLRYATSAITEGNWNSASQVTGEPTPSSAGSAETLLVDDLDPEQTYYFAIKTVDEANNWSALSNVHSVTTLPDDTIPTDTAPATIANLRITGTTTSSITLAWTAPGADGNDGTASQYDLRYALAPIDESSWNSAAQAAGLSAPRVAGSAESYTMTGLNEGTTYYFAIRTADANPLWSGLSNNATGTTDQTATDTAPAAIANLAPTSVTLTSISLTWTAPGADGNTGTASQYDLRYSQSPISASNWSSATQAAGLSTPQAAGNTESFTVADLAVGTTYFFAIRTADANPLWSDLSNIAAAATESMSSGEDTDIPPAAIADLNASATSEHSITVTWTAPGCDGFDGTAYRYFVKCATFPITSSNFRQATTISGVSRPLPSGSTETLVCDGLDAATTYYFAVRAADSGWHWSDMSNIASATTVLASTDPIAADFSISDIVGQTPMPVQFTDQSSGEPTAWEWDFGDGTTSADQNPTHVYSTAGTYSVSLTVTGADGSDTETKDNAITLTSPPPPTAAFSVSETSGDAPLAVSFTDQSTGEPTSWQWSFGDGNSSADQNPSHTYQDAGEYTISLTVTNDNGSTTEAKTDIISVTTPAQGMHVEAMKVIRSSSRRSCRGIARVTVEDADGRPVAGATVTINYDGPTSGELEGQTDKVGMVLYRLDRSRICWRDEWCVEVLDITHDDYEYEPMNNAVTEACESGWQDTFADGSSTPAQTGLAQNYPNPFNPTTEISFSLAAPTHVRLVVYNVLGQEVQTLVDDTRGAGEHQVMWNGRDGGGSRVASGLYLYRLEAGDYVETRKMMMMK